MDYCITSLLYFHEASFPSNCEVLTQGSSKKDEVKEKRKKMRSNYIKIKSSIVTL